MTDSRVVVLVDEIHPLVEYIRNRLVEAGVRTRLLHWKDLVVTASSSSQNLWIEELAGVEAVYIDRLSEDEHCYATQLELLALWEEETGAVFVNRPRPYWHARDKALTAARLAAVGIPTPDTTLCFTHAQVQDTADGRAPDGPIVVKSLQGVCSDEVLIAVPGELSKVDVHRTIAHDGAVVVQAFVDNPERFIWRVDIVDEEAIVVNRRYAYNSDGPPVCNGTHGGDIEFIDPSAPEAAFVIGLAVRATRALDLAVSGVDIAVDREGRLSVLEVNPDPDITLDGTGVRDEFPAAIADGVLRRLVHKKGVPG